MNRFESLDEAMRRAEAYDERGQSASGERDDSWDRFDDVPPAAGEAKAEAKGEAVKIKASPFRWRDPKSFPLRPWLYGTTYIRHFITVTAGPGGFGKSSLVLVEAIAMATGRALLGIQTKEMLRVWYVNLEDPLEEIEKRVAAICLCFGITEVEIGGRLFLNSGDECEVIVMQETGEGARVCRPVVEAVLAEMRANAIDALFLDPFASTHGIDENSNARINAVKNVFASIARQSGASVGLVHHVRKGTSGQAGYTIDDSRGAKALIDGARIGRVLNGMSKEEGESAGVEEPRRYFHITHGKSSLAPPTDKRQWFHLRSVSLGNGEGPTFDESDHVGVVETWEWPDPLEDVEVIDLRKVQAAVGEGQWRASAQSPEWVGVPIAKVLGLNLSNKAHKSKVAGLIKTWIGTEMLSVVDGQDKRRKPVKFVEVGKPATDCPDLLHLKPLHPGRARRGAPLHHPS